MPDGGDLDIDRESWFLYAQMTSPLPVYIHSGWWNSYPGVEELANHLHALQQVLIDYFKRSLASCECFVEVGF